MSTRKGYRPRGRPLTMLIVCIALLVVSLMPARASAQGEFTPPPPPGPAPTTPPLEEDVSSGVFAPPPAELPTPQPIEESEPVNQPAPPPPPPADEPAPPAEPAQEEADQPQPEGEIEQMRAFWASSYNEGYRNHAEVDELIANVKRANANTVIVQMRRHGDSWYTRSIEPRAADPHLAPAAEFDALDYLIQKGHENGIKVHAWLVVTVTCRNHDALRGHPQHVCTAHGPGVEGPESWTTLTHSGTPVGDLDFGHPSAIHHMEAVVENLLHNYPQVDGVHFDFIRYSGREFGYNPVSVERFNRAYDLPANNWPAPTDPAWSQWRRDRMTELMRRLYIRSKAINFDVEVSIAAITWGGIGTYSPDDWPNSAAYNKVFQDWRAWLEEGIVDFAVPMQYFEEGKEPNRSWYNGWLNFGRDHTGTRAIVPGLGSWFNTPDQNLAQIQRALEPDEHGRYLSGVAFYAYHNLFVGSNFERRREFMDYLGATVFAQPARAPAWPWVVSPTKGMVQGIATIDGEIIPDAQVSLIKDGQWVRDVTASVDGWYGAVELEPGTYAVLVKAADGREAIYEGVSVVPGVVAHGS